jgi:transposase
MSPPIRPLKHGQLSREQKRSWVLGLMAGGMTDARIAPLVGWSTRTLKRVRQRWNRRGSVTDAPRSGRPRRLTARHRARLREAVYSKEARTLKQARALMATEFPESLAGIGRTTVYRALGEVRLRWVVRRKKSELTTEQKEARMAYSLIHKDDPPQKNRLLIFCDEKYFYRRFNPRGEWIDFDDPPPVGPVGKHILLPERPLSPFISPS